MKLALKKTNSKKMAYYCIQNMFDIEILKSLRIKRIFGLCIGLLMITSLVFTQEQINPNGYNAILYPNGKVSSEGWMKNGQPEGFWRTFYPTGIIKSEGKRKNHLLDSTWIFFTETGDTLQKINYVLGKRNGYTVTYRTSQLKDPINKGSILSEELFVNDIKEGISRYYYDKGNLKEEVFFSNNKRHGSAKEYDEKGLLITLQTFNKGILTERERINRKDKDGLKQGVWRTYYENNKIKSELYYKDDVLNGPYKEYDENGLLLTVLNYSNGKVLESNDTADLDVEIRNEYDESGNLIYSGSYHDNIPIGIHRIYDETGKVKTAKLYNDFGNLIGEGIITNEGMKEGEWNDYYIDGTLKAKGNYLSNLRTGKWGFYYKNGSVEQRGSYKNGKEEGLWEWYYENESIKRQEEYYNGKEEGEYIEYDTSGNIVVSGKYFDGQKEGAWTIKAGDNSETGSYVGDLKDGKWKSFYADGKIKYEGNYIQGNPDGEHIYYYNSGKIHEQNYYVMGIRDKNWKKYDENGVLIINITYKDDKEYRINGEKIDLAADDIKLIR